MSFDWMEASRNPALAAAGASRRAEAALAEIEDRAALLQRLGFSRERAAARLRAGVAWELEGLPDAGAAVAAVDAAVAGVYARGNRRT